MSTQSGLVKTRRSLDTLDHPEQLELAKNIYSTPGHFQKMFSTDSVELTGKEHIVNLRNHIHDVLVEKLNIKISDDLENLHAVLSDEMKAYNFEDGVNKISTYFYDLGSQFIDTYHQLIKHLKTHFIEEHFWFQATPTIRIHCPDSINSHLYPRYHTDICYGHPPEEINIWIPLTAPQPDHGFRIMSVEQSRKVLEKYHYDYNTFIHEATHNRQFSSMCDTIAAPVETAFGNILLFDPRCVHSGEPLKSHTRISIDVRILPVNLYKQMDIEYQGKGRRKILFRPGHCYHQNDSSRFF